MPFGNISVILVEPEHDENIGSVARAMANFSFKSLILVNPKADHLSIPAKSRAMHGFDVLKNAKLCNSLEKAIKDFDFTIATSAKLSQDRKIKRVAISAEECAKKFSGSKAKFAIIFGPESSGLGNRQIALCDMLVHIPASEEYPTLNLSHSAAIILYEFAKRGREAISGIPARKETKETLLSLFKKLMDCSRPRIKNKPETFRSFRAMLSRSLVAEKEAKSMIAVFSGVLKNSCREAGVLPSNGIAMKRLKRKRA